MATKMVIDPVTRIEGHLKIEVTADLVNGQQQVVEARATGTLFRGFETILPGRDPFDAPDITARICGVCPTPHKAAVAALTRRWTSTSRTTRDPAEPGAGRRLPPVAHPALLPAGRARRHAAARHVALAAGLEPDIRFDGRRARRCQPLRHGADMRRKAHEMGAIFGGRLPHTAAFVGGGFTGVPTLGIGVPHVSDRDHRLHPRRYLPDVEALARGTGSIRGRRRAREPAGLGVFDEDARAPRLLRRGRNEGGRECRRWTSRRSRRT